MRFKLIVALTGDERVDAVVKAAREHGATGATVITGARGEGLRPEKTFFGLDLTRHRNVALIIVEEHLARPILEAIAQAGAFDAEPGAGIAIQLDIEDAVGMATQVEALRERGKGVEGP